MAGRLVGAGHAVTVWNRTAAVSHEFARRFPGARVADTPAAAAAECTIALSMVADDEASVQVWEGAYGGLAGLREGALMVECSTVSRGRVANLHALAAQHHIRYLDAPVTGLPDAAAEGQLTILAGGDAADLAAARPVLDALGNRTLHFGPVGSGTAYKLVINLMGAVQIAAAAEGLRIAVAAGLDLKLVARAIASSQAAAPQVVRNVNRMIADDHHTDIVFTGRLRLKDARYGVEAARALGVDPRFGDLAVDAFSHLVDSGDGDCNESKIYDVTS